MNQIRRWWQNRGLVDIDALPTPQPTKTIIKIERYDFKDGTTYLLDYPKAGVHAFYSKLKWLLDSLDDLYAPNGIEEAD